MVRTEANVDDGIDQSEAAWEFDRDVAEQFDDHVQRSIPNYRTIQRAVTKLTDWFLTSGESERLYDLGCATGETITELVNHHGPETGTQYVGVDEQPAMLAEAGEKIPSHAPVRLVEQDITDSPQFPDASVVTSLFTLSFLSEQDRQRVFNAVYDDLNRGGAFIFVEKTRATSAFYQDIWTEHYWDFKSGQGLDDSQILDKARSLRGQLRPLTHDEYREMLAEAGFDVERDVELFYAFYPWSGFIARKP